MCLKMATVVSSIYLYQYYEPLLFPVKVLLDAAILVQTVRVSDLIITKMSLNWVAPC